jgi:hypothetical protein
LKRHLFKTQQLLTTLGLLLHDLRNQILVKSNQQNSQVVLRKVDNLLQRYRSILTVERRVASLSRNELINWNYRNYFSNLLSLFALNRSLSKATMNLIFRAKLVELQFHGSQVFGNNELVAENVIRVWNDRINELVEQQRLWFRQLDHLYRNILRMRLRRLFYSGQLARSEENPRPRSLLYFLARRRSKKDRRHRIARLKAVHWYIPRYMLFDFRTLRAVVVEPPRQEQIHYSFRCSLSKIHSFYRALGL